MTKSSGGNKEREREEMVRGKGGSEERERRRDRETREEKIYKFIYRRNCIHSNC